MNKMDEQIEKDPLGLSDLPLLDPGKDGWDEIRAALEDHQRSGHRRRRVYGAIAMAASLVLVVGLAMNRPALGPSETPDSLTDQGETQLAIQQPATGPDETTSINELIVMSQLLEGRLRTLRDSTGALPAQSATYIAELEDLVARVDGQLSFSPDSVDLWGQRVNLLMDLEMIYQHHWEREYGRMASL